VSVTNIDEHEDIYSLIYENIFYYDFVFLVLITKIPSCFHFLHWFYIERTVETILYQGNQMKIRWYFVIESKNKKRKQKTQV